MEVLSDLVSKGAATVWVITVDGGPWCWSTVATYWKELCCAMLGALVWTVLTPLLSVVVHFATAVGLFVYKWASLLKLCLRRFRRFVKKRATLSTSRCDYCWALFEAMWATPMVVLEARREHEQGLGRLLHRWIVAYHELWCVFLPNSVEYGWRSTKKYGGGVQIEWGRTMGRARCVFQGLWTLMTLVTFGCFYGVVGVYELFEWVCLGWKGVTALLAMINYYYANTGDVNVAGLFSMKSGVALGSGAVLLVGCTSRVWRWYEDSAEGRTPARMAKDGYAAWIRKLEEQEQAKRLSEAFWRLDGCDPSVKPKPLKTISEKRAEYEALKAKWRAEEAEAARRGRRALVGEDVPSGSGGRRLGTAHDAECWSVTEQLANQLAEDFCDASD